MSFHPDYLGGANTFNKNIIKYILSKDKESNIFWVYFGKENRAYIKDKIRFIELKSPSLGSPLSIRKSLLISRFFKKNYFDIINSRTGIWTHLYKKKRNQKLIQTFHGTRYYFNKKHYERFNFIKKILLFGFLATNWIVDVPTKQADRLICVSEKAKRQVQKLFGKKKNIVVIRTGVDLKKFKVRNKKAARKRLGLDLKKSYGLYIGRGGYWTKGLDRAVKISGFLYKKDKQYRLIVIGPDREKVEDLINKEFIIYLKEVDRKDMPFYYNASDIVFCASRYEGGAPSLVVSEAMASGCLIVYSKSSEQEIIENEKNGIILENFGKKDAKKIEEILKNEKEKKRIIKNSIKTIQDLSIEKWGKRYLNYLIN
jgi:glycosyltransferase involved in cell wall biosynthesis